MLGLGFENQQRLKELNLETWEKRKEVEHLDATTLAARLRGEAETKERGTWVAEREFKAES